MHAVLFLLALFLLSEAKPLKGESSAAKFEYKIRSETNVVKAQNVELGEQYGRTAAMKKRDASVSGVEGVTTMAKPVTYSSADENVIKRGLWNFAKKAASVIFKSARKSLAILTDQISCWLRGGSNSETGAKPTAAHVIKRKNLDGNEQEHISKYNTKLPVREIN